MAKIRVTVVVENTAQGPQLLAEHGLAYWIEYGDHRILFDTGQGNVLASNAYKLGLSLLDSEAIILSHGHYDHTGGMAFVLKTQRRVAVYAHPEVFRSRFIRTANGSSREIGMPYASVQAIKQPGVRFVETSTATKLFGGFYATGPVPRQTDYEDTGGSFFLDAACSNPDPLLDDQSAFFETKEGIVVLLGCAHSGVVNTLQYINELSRGAPIRAVIGGMHLVNASAERIARTVEEFKRIKVQSLAPCHCTWMAATVALWNAFPDNLIPCHVGSIFQFEMA
jgi:7,8-dihydropterin-6-yl-methyl-4-(beta-D-ribofuranosyl)aminobenzene 5'-phosphate synthase